MKRELPLRARLLFHTGAGADTDSRYRLRPFRRANGMGRGRPRHCGRRGRKGLPTPAPERRFSHVVSVFEKITKRPQNLPRTD